METCPHEEVVRLTSEVARCTQWCVARPELARPLFSLLRTHAANQFNVAVEEERRRLAGVAVVEEPRSCPAAKIRVYQRIWCLLEPIVLDHARLERWVLATRHWWAAIACRELRWVRIARRRIDLPEHLGVVHRCGGEAVAAVLVSGAVVGEFAWAREVLADVGERNHILRRVKRRVVEAAVDVVME